MRYLGMVVFAISCFTLRDGFAESSISVVADDSGLEHIYEHKLLYTPE